MFGLRGNMFTLETLPGLADVTRGKFRGAVV